MPRQDPLKREVHESSHRLNLSRPGIPAVIPVSRQLSTMPTPGEVIAGEEVSLPKQQHAVAFRVTRSRDDEELVSQLDRLLAVEDVFRIGLRRQLVAVNDAAA